MTKEHWEFYDATDGINGTVYAIQQDKEGNLWFATSHCGVTQYDGKNFTNFITNDGLPHNTVTEILMEEDGDLWFGSTAGVARYSNGSFVNLRNELPDNSDVRAICEDSSGCLWFVMGNGSIWRYDRKNFVRCIKGDGLSSNNYVMGDICEDSKGNLWFGTKNGVSRYDGKSFVNFTTEDGLANDMVRASLEDLEGNLWFATANGISKYDGKSY